MSDLLKKFLDKKKRDAKFKLAGPGHKLTDDTKSANSNRDKDVPKRSEPGVEAKQAGQAALARNYPGTSSEGFSMLNALRNEVLRELGPQTVSLPSCSSGGPKPITEMAVKGVYFRCPAIGPEVLSKEEWKTKIRTFLYDSLEDERGLTSCLIIHSCNKDKDKIMQCITILCTYLQNIIDNPTEEKYQRIRIKNKIFQDKVLLLEGGLDFLMAAGFENKILSFKEWEEEFLVYNPEKCDIETLTLLIDALRNAEPITIELDRGILVLTASQASTMLHLPDEFYNISAEDIKREQLLRTERLDSTLQLKTRAMREKEEQKALKKYKYGLIRIRFPDGVFLQGTFSVYEKFKAVREFVRENLLEAGQFTLSSALGNQFVEADNESSLMELRLVPASMLIFAWAQEENITSFLKPELLDLIQTI